MIMVFFLKDLGEDVPFCVSVDVVDNIIGVICGFSAFFGVICFSRTGGNENGVAVRLLGGEGMI